MQRTLTLILAGLVGITAALGAKNSPSAFDKSKQSALETARQDYLPNMVVVKFKNRRTFGEAPAKTGLRSLDQVLKRFQVYQMRQFVSEEFLQRKNLDRTVAIESIYNLRFRGDHSPPEVARALQANPHVEYAEPKYYAYISDIPNDELFNSMSQFEQINAPAAWDVVKGEAGQVVIAVVDGGTRWDHPDLIDNVWQNPGEIPDNGVDDDGNGFVDDVLGWNFATDSNDPSGLSNTPGNASHGTHVAGTAAGVTNNGLGVSSISWNCRLMPINAGSATLDRSIPFGFDGIAYAAANGADIINCSWGGGGSGSSLRQDVINFARLNGTLVVAAAGNDGLSNDRFSYFPANYQHVLAVGATQKTSDVRASFSNYGVMVDVFAPGLAISSTVPPNSYSSFSGTSMASPLVAGLAGLLKTLRPDFTVDQLREQIRVSSDPIDDANPALAGFLGKGRINAARAVTDFSLPAIRIADLSFSDSGGDEVIDAGESVTLTLDVINYLANTSGISLTLSSPNDNITITDNSAALGALGTFSTQSASFNFVVANGVADGTILRFYLDISAGSYFDREFFQLIVSPPRVASHNTGAVQTSITTEGNIGFTGFAGTPGVGFVHDGFGYLFEGGLLIGTGAEQVSDCVRGEGGGDQDVDFTPAAEEALLITSPGEFANEEGAILLTDSSAANPLGISVLQRSHADNRPENQDFVIFQYTVFNNNVQDLNNVFVGLFFDWDINPSAADFARFDQDRRMGYVLNSAASPTRIAATRLLSEGAGLSYRSIHNPNELYDDFTAREKWNFLSGGIQTTTLNEVDISTLLSAGPYTIPGNGSIEVVFAVIGAGSQAELQITADRALEFWNNPPTAIEEPPGGIITDFRLYQNYPNPFNPATAISYQLAAAGTVDLSIYNVLGQRIRTLVATEQAPGFYTVRWDGRDANGAAVASGIYLYRLEAGRSVQVKKMVLLE